MKKVLERFKHRWQTLPLKSKTLLRLGLVLSLFVALPLFILAIQNSTELREKAASGEPTGGRVCWNKAVGDRNAANWPNGCKGSVPPPGLFCTQALVPLTPGELVEFGAWIDAGRPTIAGCGQACPTFNPPNCRNGVLVPQPDSYGCPRPPICDTATNACTSNADCLCGLDRNTRQCAIGNRANITGRCNAPDFCTGISGKCGPACVNNRCQFQCPGSPTPTATPITNDNYLLQPTENGNVSVKVDNTDGIEVSVYLTKNGSLVADQSDLIYSWSINNPEVATITPVAKCITGVNPPCPADHLRIRPLKATTTPALINVSVAKASNAGVFLAASALNLTVMPKDVVTQTMQFWVSFAGVAADQADGAMIKVRMVKGTTDLTTPAFPVHYVTGNLYEGSIDLSSNPLPVGGGYTFYVKGEKHLAMKFCQDAGSQFTRCEGQGNLVVNNGNHLYGFNHLELAPGDLPGQDGVANINDFTKIKNLFNKSCSLQTDADKLTADLDYSGCVNVRDAFLMRQTLESRYDEN